MQKASPEDRSLDALSLCAAGVQTGFGPFIPAYLAQNGWSQAAIGDALSVGTVTGMVSYVPAGVLVDLLSSKRIVASVSMLCLMACSLSLAVSPTKTAVFGGQVLHGIASCTFVPAVAVMSLAIAGSGPPNVSAGERMGRNARFGAVGSAAAACLMGCVGAWFSTSAVFFLAAALCVPAVWAVMRVREAAPAILPKPRVDVRGRFAALLKPRLLMFALCFGAFQAANAAILPLAAGRIAVSEGGSASVFLAAAVIVPQAIMALTAPWVGRRADRIGYRAVLFAGFAVVPLRALLLCLYADPAFLVAIQALDGVGAAVLGVMLPLVVARIAGTGHYNLSFGAIGLAGGLGASVSTAVAGRIADAYSVGAAFGTLAAVGAAGAALVLAVMPGRGQRP